MAIWRNTTYEDLTGSGNEQLALNNGRATRIVKVRWDDHIQAAQDFLGSTTRSPNGIPRRLSPHKYSDNTWMFCTSVNVEGVGVRSVGLDGLAKYEWAKLTLGYQGLSYGVISSPNPTVNDEGIFAGIFWSTRVVEPANRLMVLGKGLMSTVDDAVPANRKPMPEGLPVVFPGMKVTYLWHNVPYKNLPIGTWLEAQGKINDSKFDIIPQHTGLLEECSYTMETNAFFDKYYCTVRYVIKVSLIEDPFPDVIDPRKIKGWNHILEVDPADKSKLRMFLVSSDGTSTGTRKYRTYDFTQLFRLAP